MKRDCKMRELISQNLEPITTPFIQKVQSLYNDLNVSTILVVGGCGDYFEVASSVIMMNCYQCYDVTSKAKLFVRRQLQQEQHRYYLVPP